MKFIKTLLASVAFIAMASSANAATDVFTGQGAVATIDLLTLDAGLNAYTTIVNPVSTFNHSYLFSLPELSNVGATLNNIVVQFPGFDVFNISDATYSILNASSEVIGSSVAGTPFSISGLTAGNYTFQVTGKTIGAAGGNYGFAINVTPVPEPSSAAMLLIGFAALGAVARRRKTL